MATYNKIQVEDKNEGEKIAWAQSKTKIIFGDDDLAIRCDTRQRDIPVTVDVCMDDQNNLTIGTGTITATEFQLFNTKDQLFCAKPDSITRKDTTEGIFYRFTFKIEEG